MHQFFVTLAQPYPLLFVAMAVALILPWRRRASRRRMLLVTVIVALLTLVNLPIVGELAVGSLE